MRFGLALCYPVSFRNDAATIWLGWCSACAFVALINSSLSMGLAPSALDRPRVREPVAPSRAVPSSGQNGWIRPASFCRSAPGWNHPIQKHGAASMSRHIPPRSPRLPSLRAASSCLRDSILHAERLLAREKARKDSRANMPIESTFNQTQTIRQYTSSAAWVPERL